MKALVFDCDGVLADTERDGHRVAFNRAFQRLGLNVQWSVEEYGRLLSVAGGKERLAQYFERQGWPEQARDRQAFIQEVHRLKTDLYMRIIEQGELPLRPGVIRLIDEAFAEGLALAVCSTSSERAVRLLVEVLLGPERAGRFGAILAGDVVARKKPDPEIYLLAGKTLGLRPEECLVVEDSRIGLLAAKAAAMRCIITRSCYTQKEDFTEADGVYSELGDPPSVYVTIRDLKRLVL